MAGGARSRSFGTAWRAVGFGLLCLVTAPVLPAGASATRAGPSQDGWWNRLQGPAEGEPDGNPVRPLVPPIPAPPNVPADAIATSGGAGQVDKVAAVGIDLALADGATVEGLTLRLKETAGGGANVGAEQAKVLACPATTPWGPAPNGAWGERPSADCGLGAAEGVRGDDGTWTFDLTALGRLWADPFAPLAQYGVVLSVDPAASPSPVQVSWLNLDSGGIAVDLAATPGLPLPDGADAAAPEPLAAAPAPPRAAPFVESPTGMRSFPTQGTGGAADPLTFASGQPTFTQGSPAASDSPDVVGAPAGRSAEPAPPAPAQSTVRPSRVAVDFWEHLSAPTAILVPAALGITVLIGVILGPKGRPSPVFAREGGLSRALARRSSAGGPV